jgi:hypothetical protein
MQRIRLGSDVEDGVDAVGRARRGDASLDAVQVNHLATDEVCPFLCRLEQHPSAQGAGQGVLHR